MNKTIVLALLMFQFLCAGSQVPNWDSLPYKLNYATIRLHHDTVENALYIMGAFTRVNDTSGNIIRWNGTSTTIYNMPYFNVYSIANFKGKVHAVANGYAYRLDDSIWTPLTTADTLCGILFPYSNKLMTPQEVEISPGKSVTNIALWNGSSWTSVFNIDTLFSAGGPCGIQTIAEYKGELYFGGNMNPHGKPSISEIVRFDGQHWKDVGGGIQNTGLGGVNKLLVWKGDLFACGEFFERQGAPGNCIARWDGTSWHKLAGGVLQGNYEGDIEDMVVFNNKLYCVGRFSTADGIDAPGMAAWDGQKWCSVSDDFNGQVVSSVSLFNGSLYMSGSFRANNGDSSYRFLAKWKGGDFSDACSQGLSVPATSGSTNSDLVYPNPAYDHVYVRTPSIKSIIFYDAVGRCVLRVSDNNLKQGIDIHSLPGGLYTVRIVSDNHIAIDKILKLD